MSENNPWRAELAEALLADLTDQPQRCGHSSDPMCCPWENFPLLGAWFAQATSPPEPIPDDPWDPPWDPPPGPGETSGECCASGCCEVCRPDLHPRAAVPSEGEDGR